MTTPTAPAKSRTSTLMKGDQLQRFLALEQIDAITSGVMLGAITQNPIGIGADCVGAAVDAINGKTLPAKIDTGFYWYDNTNINDAKIQAVLYK
jgi:ribose transport system substrate-binding protein